MQPTTRLLVAASVLALAASAAADPVTVKTPVHLAGADVVSARIDPVGDTDTFAVFLIAGDTLSVKSSERKPSFGLFSTLSMTDPAGADAAPLVKGQGKQKASFKFTAVTTGLHVVSLQGDPGGFGGSTGTYTFTVAVKRAKVAPAAFSDAAGGAISVTFTAVAGSSATISASTKKGGFDLTELRRPDATPEPGFSAALKAKKRLAASLSKFPLTGASGAYELRGTYDAGSKVAVKVTISSNEKKRPRVLNDDEPIIDPLNRPSPPQGVAGTRIKVAGVNFDDIPLIDAEGNVIGHQYPVFTLGSMVIPPANVSRLFDQVYEFPVPAGVVAGQTYGLSASNADGQGTSTTEAFFVVPPPVALSFSPATAGPAGGRTVRITGTNLRRGQLVKFDDAISQPTDVKPGFLDVHAPVHAPGPATITVYDEYGQSSTIAGTFTYLDIGSNRITSVTPTSLQGLGGELVTVDGIDFGVDTVLTLDDASVGATRVSDTRFTFTAPIHADDTVKLRVTDPYEQTHAVDIRTKGFTDDSANLIPGPVTTANAVDGWRATRVLVGDVNGDNRPDLVLLRPEPAFGNDANRSRLRLLLNGATGFTDATTSKLPGVSGDEDWRAKAGVLADLDGNGSLDIAIITDDPISGGARSSLRILTNNGAGAFTDSTNALAPGLTGYGDVNQGVAIAAANFDGVNGADLVIVQTGQPGLFTETIIISGGTPTPPDPPPPDTVITNYYPYTRVLLNNGSGVFSRRNDALPAVTPTSTIQYQADAVAVGDVDGQNGPDILLSRDNVLVDPANASNFLLTTSLLTNDGSGVFADVSASKLPAKSDPEYMQADRLFLADIDGDGDLDLLAASNTRLVSPVTSQIDTTPALRLFTNNGTGTFSALLNALPAADGLDSLQCEGVAVGDLTGDGKPEIFAVSGSAPNFQGNGGRVMVKQGSAWGAASVALPSPLTADDARGADVVFVDVDGDGDLDVVIVRDESNQSVRNTIVMKNPWK